MARSTSLNAAPFSPSAHVGQREIFHELMVFRLFFEERLQFAARLSPSFLGGG